MVGTLAAGAGHGVGATIIGIALGMEVRGTADHIMDTTILTEDHQAEDTARLRRAIPTIGVVHLQDMTE